MGNIVGEKFEPFVSTQIAVRQVVYGAGYKDETREIGQLQLMNNKNSWIKMASSVHVIPLAIKQINQDGVIAQETEVSQSISRNGIDSNISSGEQRLIDIGLDNTYEFTGDKLSQKTVLFNTLSEVNPTQKNEAGDVTQKGDYNFRSGVSSTNSLFNNSSYGLGGTDMGIVPAPGVVSFKVDSQTRGSIRKGTVEIKCFNKFQFELIELVYLRLGFTMMVEWGWDKFTPDGKKLIPVGNTIIEDKWFTNKGKDLTQLEMLSSIKKYQQFYSGNYDGFYGKVSNFNWKFNADGTYDISIDLITIGDVIESLIVDTKATTLTLDKITEQKKTNPSIKGLGDSPIVTNAGNNSISQDMFLDIQLGQSWSKSGSPYLKPSMFFFNGQLLGQTDKATKALRGAKKDDGSVSFDLLEEIKADSDNESLFSGATDRYGYYMTFGTLIRKLINNCIPSIENDSNEGIDMLQFDDDEYSNVCSVYPNQISLDPRVCLISPSFSIISNTNNSIEIDPGWKYLKPFGINETIGDSQITYGRIMNIYLNYDFIASILEKHTESTGGLDDQLTIYAFLTAICDGINSALGGLNNLEVVIKDDNVVTIIEQNPIAGIEKTDLGVNLNDPKPTFEIMGFNPENGEASFVKDFNFDTKITPELASMISIGATAGGTSTKNYDATAFSSWNTGLYDRFNYKFVDPDFEKHLKDKRYTSELSEKAGVISNDEIDASEGFILWEAFKNSEFDEDSSSRLTNLGESLSNGNYYTFGISMAIGLGLVSPEITKTALTFSEALNVKARGQRTIPANGVHPEKVEEVTWARYVKTVTDYRIAKKKKEDEGLTQEQMATRFGDNYLYYLTRVLGGKFTGQIGSIDETLITEATYFKYNGNDIKEGRAAFKAYMNSLNNYIYSNSDSPSNTIGFIPVSFAMTFEGLSGIKIYNQINVRQGFLPKQYGTSLKFLISTVSHEISEGKWETSLDTISTPRTYESTEYSFQEFQNAVMNTIVIPANNGLSQFTGATPNADRLRSYLYNSGGMFFEKSSGADGKGGATVPEEREIPNLQGSGTISVTAGELSSGGDITAKMAQQGIDILSFIASVKNEFPSNFKIKISAGNDLYHQNMITNYRSRHQLGEGLDIVVENATRTTIFNVERILKGYTKGTQPYYFINEYQNPSNPSTGDHFHLTNKSGNSTYSVSFFEGEFPIKEISNGVREGFTPKFVTGMKQ